MSSQLRRHVASAAVLVAFVGFNTATSKPAGSTADATAVIAPTAAAPSTVADLDVPTAQLALGCTAKATSDGCRILNDFSSATTPSGWPPVKQEAWYGQSFSLGGKTKKDHEPNFMQIKPGATAAPGVAGLMVIDASGSLRLLIPENAGERHDAETLLDLVRHGKPAPAGDKAVDYMRTVAPPAWRTLVRTVGASIGMIVDRSYAYSYLRQSGDRILVVEYDGGATLVHEEHGTEAPGWCTELWQLK